MEISAGENAEGAMGEEREERWSLQEEGED